MNLMSEWCVWVLLSPVRISPIRRYSTAARTLHKNCIRSNDKYEVKCRTKLKKVHTSYVLYCTCNPTYANFCSKRVLAGAQFAFIAKSAQMWSIFEPDVKMKVSVNLTKTNFTKKSKYCYKSVQNSEKFWRLASLRALYSVLHSFFLWACGDNHWVLIKLFLHHCYTKFLNLRQFYEYNRNEK